MTKFKYLWQTTHIKMLQNMKSMPGSEQRRAVLKIKTHTHSKKKERKGKYFKIDISPYHSKTSNEPMCLANMTHVCQTWSINKELTNKQRTSQRAVDRKMLNLKLQEKVPYLEVRKRTNIVDIIDYTPKQKWNWAGCIARMKNNRWIKCCTEWQPGKGRG